MVDAVTWAPMSGDEPLPTERAAAVFRGLGDPTRVAVLVALAEHERAGGEPVSFSELRRLADVEDSGRFNYHLKELVPRFIGQTEDGYRLRYAGRQAYALVAGGAGTDEAIERIERTDIACLFCDNRYEARYENDLFQLCCPDHGQIVGLPLPPTVVADADIETLVDIADTAARSEFEFVRAGVCGECWGPVEVAIDRPDPPEAVDDIDMLAVRYTCTVCAHGVSLPLRYVVGDHPAVVSFHRDHGIDLPKTIVRELDRHLAVVDADLGGGDPPGATVTFGVDGDRLTVTVDADARVVATERWTET